MDINETLPRRKRELDFSDIQLFSAKDRINLVTIDTLLTPDVSETRLFNADGFIELSERIKKAKSEGREIIVSIGAHVIKCGLSRYIIKLAENGFITHFAANGASSIHDFELAYLGGTSEDVPTAIEDGSFGMWYETGTMMNEAISLGAKQNLGYGEALGKYIDENPKKFPYREDCILYRLYKLDIPTTYHVALGTDIIHQMPSCNMADIGKCSGIDFKKMAYSVSRMNKGVYMNFGSAVIGPEVFLKTLSIARNLKYPVYEITTANFDLKDLGDFRKKIGYNDPNYYYRPRKNIVNRPVSRGGWGMHFVGDHAETIPSLYKLLTKSEEN